MPSQGAVKAIEFVRSATLICMAMRTPFRVTQAGREVLPLWRRSPSDLAAALEQTLRFSARFDDSLPAAAVDQRLAAQRECRHAEPDDHRHAARARQHGHVTGRAAAGENDRAAFGPIERQETGRRKITRRQNRAGRDRQVFVTGETGEHAVTQVLEVCGSGLEVLIRSGRIVGDLGIEHRAPRFICRRAGRDLGQDRLAQSVVLQKGELEAEYVGARSVGMSPQTDKLRCGGRKGST